MNKNQPSEVRFESLYMQNYGVFQKPASLAFEPGMTVILARNGLGKTTILRALEHRGVAPGMEARGTTDSPVVRVCIAGDAQILDRHKNLVFLGDDISQIPKDTAESITPTAIAQDIYKEMCRMKRNEEWNANLSMSEDQAMGLAITFAARRELELDVPLVLDSPLSCLDEAIRTGVMDFLEHQTDQIILLLSEHEWRDRGVPHYILSWINGGTQVLPGP